MYFFRGFVHLGAGLAVGLSGLAAGYAIGIVGDAGVRGTAQQPRLFVGMILILIFAEVCAISRKKKIIFCYVPIPIFQFCVISRIISYFFQVLGLYGLIVAIYLFTNAN